VNVKIFPIQLGIDQCYLLQHSGLVMVDAGDAKRADVFKTLVGRLSLRAEDIRLIVLTHGHWDHIGSAKDLKELTGSKIALHQKKRNWLEKRGKFRDPGCDSLGAHPVRTHEAGRAVHEGSCDHGRPATRGWGNVAC